MIAAMKTVGTVYLVGAGPGDPDYLTVKASRLIESCDVVVYDRLVSTAVMAMVPNGTQKINVGKQPKNHPVPQHEINPMLVHLARSGRTVVRLKGGDPFLFGRGGEEAQALAAADIPFEVVPGITSAQGCAASLKMPLTLRGVAQGVRYITGHCQADADLDFDWHGLSDPATTLVVYMGLAHIGQIADQLVAHGRAAHTRVVAVSQGTLQSQKQVVTTLGAVRTLEEFSTLRPPTLFVIGEVVDLATTLEIECCARPAQSMSAAE